MNARERRERDQQRARESALVGMREIVIAAQAVFLASLGSAAVIDCVDDALARMTPDECVGDPEEVRGKWIYRATCLLIKLAQSAEMRHRDPIAIDEHAQALALSVSGDVVALSEEARQCWRMEEVVHRVHEEDQPWSQAYAERVLDRSLDPGAQPRGLPQALGWTTQETKNASRRARRAMVAFIKERASGEVCRDRQALLDSFIATDSARGDDQHTVLDQKRFLEMIFHLGGCHDCALAWRARRATLAGRVAPLLALPLDAVSWAARVARDLAGSLELATLSVRQRLGLGGTSVVVTTISGKTAAVCATAVCAVGAGSAELAGVLPPIAPDRVNHVARKHAADQHAWRTHARPVVTPATYSAVTPAPAPPTRPPATSAADAPAVPEDDFTPGDLPEASSTSPGGSSAGSAGGGSSSPGDLPSASSTSTGGSSTGSPDLGSSAPVTPPPPPPPTPAAASGDGVHCVLGELGC